MCARLQAHTSLRARTLTQTYTYYACLTYGKFRNIARPSIVPYERTPKANAIEVTLELMRNLFSFIGFPVRPFLLLSICM